MWIINFIIYIVFVNINYFYFYKIIGRSIEPWFLHIECNE